MDVEIGIPEDARKEIAEGLAGLLADTYTLYLKTHGYHWNVEGPAFQSLHVMFEQQYLEMRDAVDEIAERIRALGAFAPASYAELSRLTTVPDEEGVPPADQMVVRLADAHQSLVRAARPLTVRAESAGDVATVDLVTERIRIHEKTAWMLRSTAAAAV
jgi:starvation-inducible DNA-binding protein